PVPHMIHKIAAMKKKMPANGGQYLRMRRYQPLATAMVPLGNTGETPPAAVLHADHVDAKLQFYGQWIHINEQVTLTSQDAPLNEAAIRLGVSMRQTEDQLTRDMLAATAGHINCEGGVNGDNPTELTRWDTDMAVRTLRGNDAYTVMDNIEGENKFGTAPVRDGYFALGSTDLLGDLNECAGFLNKWAYPAPDKALRSEEGTLGNLRVLLSSIGSKSVAASNLGKDVYNIFCIGMEAYATVKMDEYNAKFLFRPAIYDGPLMQNVSVGYKFAEVPRITNDLWLINLRATLST
ncbi:MAG: N4-gp56 family major capsid protein, partial [Thermotoga sp.]